MTLSRVLAVPLSLTAALALSSCASGSGDPSAAGGGSSGTLSVQAYFYPLQYVTERVGGDLVQVDSLTPASAEPTRSVTYCSG